MSKLPNRYNTQETEQKQQKFWAEKQVYKWQNDLPKDQTFVIDTPPPTVSGFLHMGHIFSYTQADFVARYKRMKGLDVFYPMGFDDNGLPTERLVEKTIGKKAGKEPWQMPREEFVVECKKIVDVAEIEFENLFNTIALSVDWDQKYQTISKESQQLSQASFVDLFNKNLVERRFAPVLWDCVDRTALSQADLVDKETPSAMHDIVFGVEDVETSSDLNNKTRHPSESWDLVKHNEDYI
jgi:valyl-tRNA synthetase